MLRLTNAFVQPVRDSPGVFCRAGDSSHFQSSSRQVSDPCVFVHPSPLCANRFRIRFSFYQPHDPLFLTQVSPADTMPFCKGSFGSRKGKHVAEHHKYQKRDAKGHALRRERL